MTDRLTLREVKDLGIVAEKDPDGIGKEHQSILTRDWILLHGELEYARTLNRIFRSASEAVSVKLHKAEAEVERLRKRVDVALANLTSINNADVYNALAGLGYDSYLLCAIRILSEEEKEDD